MTTPESPEQGPEEKEPPKKKRVDEKVTEKLEDLKKNKQVEQIYNFAKANTRDTIAYVALVVGLVMMLFGSYWGPVIIGVVVGVYFANDVIAWFTQFRSYTQGEGLVRAVVLGALLLAFLWYAPWIFLGAVITIVIKYLLVG